MSFFIVPVVGAGVRGDYRRPAFVQTLGVNWAMVDVGASAVLWASTTPAQETALAANPGVTLIPPLDNAVAVASTQAALEAASIPAQWVTAGMTYRQVLRVVCGMAMLVQGARSAGLPLTLAGNLDLTMAQIPAAMLQGLSAASDRFGLDRSSISGATTLRAALKTLGQQFLDGKGVSIGDL